MMDAETLRTALGIAAPSLGGAGLLWYCGSKRLKRNSYTQALAQEQQRREMILSGATILRPPADMWKRADGRGQICLAGAGTYFSRQLPYILETYARAGVADFVGPILVTELDDSEARICLQNIPAIFADRIIIARCPNLWAGLQGCTVEEALDLKHLWWHDVMEAVNRWLNLMQYSYQPAVLLGFISSGGMAGLLYPALTAFRERFNQAPCYCTALLDHKEVVRQRFPSVRQFYAREGLIRGMILTDNLRHPDRSDMGIALLYAAMTGASWLGSLPTSLWNGASYVFAKERAVRYATVSVWAEMLPTHHIPCWHDQLPTIHYTQAAIVEEKIIRGVRYLLEHPELQGVPLEPAGKGHTRLLYVTAPIIPDPDFRAIAQRVDANLAQWRAETDPNLLINYASIGSPMSMETTETPLVITLLQPLADNGESLDALALGTHKTDQKFFPAPAFPTVAPPALTLTARRRPKK